MLVEVAPRDLLCAQSQNRGSRRSRPGRRTGPHAHVHRSLDVELALVKLDHLPQTVTSREYARGEIGSARKSTAPNHQSIRACDARQATRPIDIRAIALRAIIPDLAL